MSVVKKKPRSLALAPDLEEKLLKLCEQLGVNPHAYLVNEVGKCVNRDYLQFQVAANQQNALADFFGKVEMAMQAEMKPKDPETVLTFNPKPLDPVELGLIKKD